MARSYKNYKQNLNEGELKLLEIGQLVQPYEKDFKFINDGINILTDFKDDKNNDIKVMFHRFKEDSESFEVEFMVNKQSGEAFKTNTKHFFKIISTVVQVINEFIQHYQPSQLYIDAFNKPNKEGQKNKIWMQYAKVNLKADGYVIGNQGNGFGIQNKNKK
tara:strand:- start:14 stop:496 length:483 start_codon:yes stop_codon:yes gene_type:complete